MYRQRQPLRVLHEQLYMLPLRSARRPHLEQSSCPVFLKTLPTVPTQQTNYFHHVVKFMFEFNLLTSFSSAERTQMHAARCRNPSLSYTRVEFGFSLTILISFMCVYLFIFYIDFFSSNNYYVVL